MRPTAFVTPRVTMPKALSTLKTARPTELKTPAAARPMALCRPTATKPMAVFPVLTESIVTSLLVWCWHDERPVYQYPAVDFGRIHGHGPMITCSTVRKPVRPP